MKDGPPISEAVSFLSRFAPQELSRLRAELPKEIQPLLIDGGLAGSVSTSLKARAQVQLAALKAVKERMSKCIVDAEYRLKWAKRIRLVGDIAAVLGSSSVLAGSASGGSPTSSSNITIIAGGIVALVGALSGVLSEYAIRLPDTGGSLFAIYRDLSVARFEAEMLIGEIDILLTVSDSEDVETRLTENIGAANALCRKVHESFPLVLQNSD